MKEKLSALIDGELDELVERRVLKALADDPELRRTWERYHLIRGVVARQLSVLAPAGLPERIRERLDSNESREAVSRLRFWPLAGGFAAAAGLAAVALLGVQLLQPSGDLSVPLAATPSDTAPVAATAASAGAAARSATASSPAPSPENAADPLNLYLVGHNEFMPTGGMGSMLPYVRVVTHGSDSGK